MSTPRDRMSAFKERVNRDADDIAGFWSTRKGVITALCLLGGIIVCSLIGMFL